MVELANPAVGRALTQISVAVLDVAGLSAPSIAEACLGPGAQELVAVRRAVRDHQDRGAAARDPAGRCTARSPRSRWPPRAARDVEVCPGRDHPVAPGDLVTLIGTPAELRAAGLPGPDDEPPRTDRALARLRHTVRALRQVVLSVLQAADRRLA